MEIIDPSGPAVKPPPRERTGMARGLVKPAKGQAWLEAWFKVFRVFWSYSVGVGGASRAGLGRRAQPGWRSEADTQ